MNPLSGRYFNARALLTGALMTAAPLAWAVPAIDTSVGATFSFVSEFGEPNGATFGQTFTVTGVETRLDSFAFRLQSWIPGRRGEPPYPDSVDFAAYIFAWDGFKASGLPLFASGLTSTSWLPNDYETFTFNTGGFQLLSGNQYVAFISASSFFDGSLGVARSPLSTNDPYSGGSFVHLNNGSAAAQWTSTNWMGPGSNDLWFLASFSAPGHVQEPATLALLGLGMLGLGIARRRRLRADISGTTPAGKLYTWDLPNK